MYTLNICAIIIEYNLFLNIVLDSKLYTNHYPPPPTNTQFLSSPYDGLSR